MSDNASLPQKSSYDLDIDRIKRLQIGTLVIARCTNHLYGCNRQEQICFYVGWKQQQSGLFQIKVNTVDGGFRFDVELGDVWLIRDFRDDMIDDLLDEKLGSSL